MIKAKQKGKDVHAEPRTEGLEALRDSVARYSRPQSRRGNRRGGGLEDLTKSELGQRAKRRSSWDSARKRRSIRGYSKMTKDELVAALR